MKNIKKPIPMKKLSRSIFLLCLICVFAASCTETDKKGKKLDNTTSGNIKISVDETLVPLINAELEIFHEQYKKAKVTPLFVPEAQVINDLMSDSVKVIFATRGLKDTE